VAATIRRIMDSLVATTKAPSVPVFFLKTRSQPRDGYEEAFSAAAGGRTLNPIFVPVLEHRLDEVGMRLVTDFLKQRKIGTTLDCRYGGMIFTSQRAVEAFSHIIAQGQSEAGWPRLEGVPIYTVGPATSRALRAIDGSLEVYGEHTGNGEELARFILEHYCDRYQDRQIKPRLLFVVGETRRDIIPRTLDDENLPASQRVQVDEVVVYATGVMESFRHDLEQKLAETATCDLRWVVVFSPTGCDAMLGALGLLGENNRTAREDIDSRRTTRIATIGPTTKRHLLTTYEVDPDVCAEKPNPEALLAVISAYKASAAEGE
jgi:uroporphyrinogen-III synthase